jgi:aldose 1-epimerase
VDDLILSVPGQSRLLLDGRSLPIGAAPVTGSEYDYTEGKRIGATVLDTAFGDLERYGSGRSHVRLATPDGRQIQVWADDAFHWWQVFTGDTLAAERRRRSVAIEPMTCPPDAFRSGRDVVTLAPGEAWRGHWGIRMVGERSGPPRAAARAGLFG